MVYAPRDDDEIDVALELVRAAAWWVGGEDITLPDRARRDSGMDIDDEAYQHAKRSSITANHALFTT